MEHVSTLASLMLGIHFYLFLFTRKSLLEMHLREGPDEGHSCGRKVGKERKEVNYTNISSIGACLGNCHLQEPMGSPTIPLES